jgi:glycine/D-amino acid oxidase-like deaminating enzyme
VPEALYWDTADPYHYLESIRIAASTTRSSADRITRPAGGRHAACYAALEAQAQRVLPVLEITHRWSGQVIETNDGLPFIGETSRSSSPPPATPATA